MRYGSVCSGIEAASVAWHRLGWEAAWLSEIEAFPSAVLAHHYPKVVNRGDMTRFQEWPDDAIDLLVGGTPCQSFSVAGLRAGLADPRGNLLLTYLAIAARYRPRWLVWENVPGVLSSGDGRDFGSLLGGLAELGYGFAYRVLDAQFCRAHGFERAVPQRRRRVFVVGYLGDWRRAAAVLFDGASLRGDPAPRRASGERVAPTISSRPTGGGGLGTDFDLDGGVIAFGSKEHAQDAGPVSPPLRAMGHDQSHQNGGGQVAIAFNPQAGDKQTSLGFDPGAGTIGTLEANQTPAIAFDTTQITSKANYSNPKPGDPCHPLASGAHPPAVAFGLELGNQGSGGNVGWFPADGPSRTLDTSTAPGVAHASASAWAVRRLTPEECEKLQGFPPGYTAIPFRKKQAADGPRYKALGNSMAVNVMRVLGQRIQQVEAA